IDIMAQFRLAAMGPRQWIPPVSGTTDTSGTIGDLNKSGSGTLVLRTEGTSTYTGSIGTLNATGTTTINTGALTGSGAGLTLNGSSGNVGLMKSGNATLTLGGGTIGNSVNVFNGGGLIVGGPANNGTINTISGSLAIMGPTLWQPPLTSGSFTYSNLGSLA